MSDDDLGGAPAPSSSVARPAPGLSRKRPRVAEAARPLAGLAQEELEPGPGFQHHRLLEVLAGKRRRARRGPGPRNLFSPRKPAVYEGTCAVFSPEDLGVPSGS